jgi:hypothetical protein
VIFTATIVIVVGFRALRPELHMPMSQLKRELSMWLEFGLILGNPSSFQRDNL